MSLWTTWRPQYEQYGTWHDMKLESADFELVPGGKITAKGTDEVGVFTFDGGFSKKDSSFKFLKQYVGQHQIFYQGKFNKKTFQFEGHWGFEPGDNQGGFRMRKV